MVKYSLSFSLSLSLSERFPLWSLRFYVKACSLHDQSGLKDEAERGGIVRERRAYVDTHMYVHMHVHVYVAGKKCSVTRTYNAIVRRLIR